MSIFLYKCSRHLSYLEVHKLNLKMLVILKISVVQFPRVTRKHKGPSRAGSKSIGWSCTLYTTSNKSVQLFKWLF